MDETLKRGEKTAGYESRLKEAIQTVDFLLQRSRSRYPESLPSYHLQRLIAWRTGDTRDWQTGPLSEQSPLFAHRDSDARNLNPLQRELEIHRCYAEALLIQEALQEISLSAEQKEELIQRALGMPSALESRRLGEIHSCPTVQPRNIADSPQKITAAIELITPVLGEATALTYGMFILAGLRARTEFENYGRKLDTLFQRVLATPETAQMLDMVTISDRRAGFEPQFRLLLAVRNSLWALKPNRASPNGFFLLTKVIDAYLSNRPTVGNILGLTTIDGIIVGKLGFPVRYLYDAGTIALEVLIENRSVYWDPGKPVPLSFTPNLTGRRLSLSDMLGLVYASIANAYFNQALWDRAVENYERVLELMPDSPETYTDIAACYLRKRLPEKALAALQQAEKLAPKSATVHHLIGNAYAMANQWREAISAYKKAVQITPKFAEAWYNMALAYEKMGSPDQAGAAFRMAIEINPNYSAAYLALGNLYLENKRINEAIHWYREAIKHDPNLVAAYYNLGRAYYEGKDLDNAIQAYQKAIKINPKHAGAWYNLGIAYRDKGNKEKAVEAIEHAVSLNPNLLR